MKRKQNNRTIGTYYEQLAVCYLESQGYAVLVCNYRCKCGEIDIIASQGDWLVFCEVKYRKSKASGSPLEAVDLRKQKRIYQCATYYLLVQGLQDVPCRFDVIGFEKEKILHIKDAFQKGCL